MCGLVGWITIDPKATPVQGSKIRDSLIACAERGDDATGITFFDGTIHKEGVGAKEFWEKNKKWMSKLGTHSVLFMHTRKTTQGDAKNNDNNHPHEGERFVLQHNGCVRAPLLKDYKYKGTCDSEVLLSYMERMGIKKAIENMFEDDNFGLVILDKQEKVVYLYRHKRPLVLTADKDGRRIYYASTADIVAEFFGKEKIGMLNLTPCMGFTSIEEDVLYRIPLDNPRQITKSDLVPKVKFLSDFEARPIFKEFPAIFEDKHKRSTYAGYHGGAYHGNGIGFHNNGVRREPDLWDDDRWKAGSLGGGVGSSGSSVDAIGSLDDLFPEIIVVPRLVHGALSHSIEGDW